MIYMGGLMLKIFSQTKRIFKEYEFQISFVSRPLIVELCYLLLLSRSLNPIEICVLFCNLDFVI